MPPVSRTSNVSNDTSKIVVHLLDVGPEEYGDSILCEFDGETILIDGAHTGDNKDQGRHEALHDQIAAILGQTKPCHVSLLVVTHAHEDHIGCLPALVKEGFRAGWALVADPDIGWGRSVDDAFVPPDENEAAEPSPARSLVAGLREEPRTDRTDDASLAEFLDAAATLEQRYRDMLDTLAGGGKVVRYGQDPLTALLERFGAIKLEVLGPDPDQLAACADALAQKAKDSLSAVSDALVSDAEASPVDMYRSLVSAVDATDARPGDAVNMTSIVARFTIDEQKFLFGGDMEFARPRPALQPILDGVQALRAKIAEGAPYAFYKLSHHGSDNGFNEDVLADLKSTRYLGICAGEKSKKHPNSATLQLLGENQSTLTWARTDRNGPTTFTYAGGAVKVDPATPPLNITKPNSSVDEAFLPVPTAASPAIEAILPTASVRGSEIVEVRARVPHKRTRVTITIDVNPVDAEQDAPGLLKPRKRFQPSTSGPVQPVVPTLPGFQLGRSVKNLIVATNAAALAENIGRVEAAAVLKALRNGGATVIDSVPRDVDAATASTSVRKALQQAKSKGVVLLGGYDVVPSLRLDALPRSLRQNLPLTIDDADNFIVWNDEIYGDVDADGSPEVPVSRIPDGKSSKLVFAALAAAPSATAGRSGIRNVARPFAQPIYDRLSGARAQLVSAPAVFNNPTFSLDTELVYIMLHGDFSDSRRFWGEQVPFEAMNIGNLPDASGATVFTGCCWGGLTVNPPAGRYMPGQTLGIKTPDESIALAFLARGASAFIGCTGSHYSPTVSPYAYFGGPMHEAFWEQTLAGKGPAEALFEAKLEYLKGMPHGQTSVPLQAIEFKILRQYTCLGLGW
jgi:beta-lactamase superfamily II metal-dependent hydrolase